MKFILFYNSAGIFRDSMSVFSFTSKQGTERPKSHSVNRRNVCSYILLGTEKKYETWMALRLNKLIVHLKSKLKNSFHFILESFSLERLLYARHHYQGFT